MKILVWTGLIVGSIIGGYVPVLFGADTLSIATVIGNAIGGLIGIWVGIKLSNAWGL